MEIKEFPSTSFYLKNGGTTVGEVRILPPVLTNGPKQVEIRTWNAKGRWRNEQQVIVDMQVLAQVISESERGVQ